MTPRAVISDCGRYRYALRRDIDCPGNEGTVLFVMLNPSTADAYIDDRTIRRCIGFSQSWGYARLTVANVFAYRATKPEELVLAEDPVGPDNDVWLGRLAASATEVVAAWGAHAFAERRARATRELLEERTGGTLSCLGQTQSLAPKHPLYLRADTPREPLKRIGRIV
jgi:hypothetical protein